MLSFFPATPKTTTVPTNHHRLHRCHYTLSHHHQSPSHLRPTKPFLRRRHTFKISAIDAAQPFDYESKISTQFAKSKTLKIAIVGFGNFGQFLAKTLVRQSHTVLAHSRTDYSSIAAKIGDADDLCEEHPELCDIRHWSERLKRFTWKSDVHLTYPVEGPLKRFIDQLCNAEVYGKVMFSFFNTKRNLRYSLSQIVDIFEGAVDSKVMVQVYDSKPGALAINKVAYGAEVHEWSEIRAMAEVTIDGCDFIDTTNRYQSLIDEIIKGLRKIIYENSAGCKGFELTSFLKRRLSIFWDIKSSPIPTNVNPEYIAKEIIAFVKREININDWAVEIYAYGHSSTEQNAKLHYSGVTLIYTPRGRKDTTYIALLVDMFKRSHNFPAPSSIMLITGNIYSANTLRALGLLGHKIILVTPSEVDVSVSLINASVYTWSDVAKGTSTSQVQIKELPDDNNNCPGSNSVKREDLVATSNIQQIIELFFRCNEFVSIGPSDTYLFMFWDIENCPIPKGVPAKDVFMNILKFVKRKIDWSRARMRAYADLSRIPGEVRESLEKSGVQLVDTPHVKKDAADEAMIIDLFMYSNLVPSPFSIMVITGDRDFATTLHAIDGFGHDIYLAIPSWASVSESLTSAAKGCWSWFEVANGIDLTGLRGQLVTLLKSNGGQLRLGSLDAEYQKMFKKPLLLSEYKADKLVNLLNKMGDVISVEDLNGETLVKLKGD